jgi:hypothetical protein
MCTTSINELAENLSLVSMTPLAAGVNYTGEKFATPPSRPPSFFVTIYL